MRNVLTFMAAGVYLFPPNIYSYGSVYMCRKWTNLLLRSRQICIIKIALSLRQICLDLKVSATAELYTQVTSGLLVNAEINTALMREKTNHYGSSRSLQFVTILLQASRVKISRAQLVQQSLTDQFNCLQRRSA